MVARSFEFRFVPWAHSRLRLAVQRIRMRVAAFFVIACFAVPLVQAANPARYVARLQNGNFIEGNTLSDWHAAGLMPKLENQALLEPSNPLRWLIDRSLPPPGLPESFIEFVTGDRLPCTILDFRNGNELPYAPQFPHLLVQYAGKNPQNLEDQATTLRIDLRPVRRIVWRRGKSQTVEPATAVLVGGNLIRFRSVRFGANQVTLLTESGIRRIAYADLAELQMPASDYWPLAFDELAILAAGGSRIVQLDTSEGLIATSSLDRYVPRVVGDARDVNRWIHGMQPAWSLDVIWVPQGTVWARRFFTPQSLPLTRIPVSRFEQQSIIGDVSFPRMINRSVSGGLLRTGSRDVGWGIGVHAFAELEYELPPEVNAIRSEFGIDSSMNDGGCVKPQILDASADNAVLYEGQILVGSINTVDCGQLALPGPADAIRKVRFQVDPVLNNRPHGADPFDIRDNANWIEPTVEFDPTRLQQQFDQRILRSIPSWRDWTVTPENASQLKWSSFFAEAPGNSGEFVTAVGVSNNPLTLVFDQPITNKDRWLVIDAVRTQGSTAAAKLVVQIRDQKQTEHELPTYDKSRTDFRPIVLPLPAWVPDRPTTIEAKLLPAENVQVLWRFASVTAQHPMLFQLFEDAPLELPKTIAKSAPPPFELDAQQKHFGAQSLVMTKVNPLKLAAASSLIIRERPQLGEYRFIRFAVRKQGGGGFRVHVNHAAEPDVPAIFETGPRSPTDLSRRYLTDAPLKDEWQVFTRDLYGDFGNINIHGLTFEMLDGQKAWIDHIYLARTQSDFDLIKIVNGKSS